MPECVLRFRWSRSSWRPGREVLGWEARSWERSSLVLVCLLLGLSHVSHPQSTCPVACECKWKSGKESVVCSERAAFRTIPSGLSPDTQMLDLTRNLIQELPNQVFLTAQLLNLQKIILRDCLVRSVGREAFAKLSNLMELDLSGNRLTEVPSASFSSIPELRELKLSSNPITVLQDNLFLPLPRLIRLELSSCLLRTIGIWAFRGLPALQWLRLDNNRLLTVQAESFFPLRSLHGLTVHGNPWNCSCALQPWRDWMTKNNVPFGVPPVCSSPPRLQGKSWSDLSLEDFACLPKIREALTESDRVRRVYEGQNATLLCQLIATPDTQVRWLTGNKGGGVVTNGSVGTTSTFVLIDSFVSLQPNESALRSRTRRWSGGTTGDRSLGLRSSNLTLIRATLRDAGIFTCQAENAAGFTSTNFTLIVLQNKPESYTGRLLFTGALVAALLMLFVCLLLCCIILTTRRVRTTTTRVLTEEKIELNHMTTAQNGEVTNTTGQNGGSNIPLLISNHHSNSNSPNCTNHNRPSSNGPVTANNVPARRAPGPTHYRALATADPDEDNSCIESRIDDDDEDGWDLSESEVRVRTVNRGVTRPNPPRPAPRAPPPAPRSLGPNQHPLQLRTQELDHGGSSSGVSSNFFINNSSGAGSSINSGGPNSRPKYLPPRPPQPRDIKFPDLINQKVQPDFSSLPRQSRNQDMRPGKYFHSRNISESQSPLLSHSYGNSFETIPEGRYVPSVGPTGIAAHSGSAWAQQRLSMPTSPTHESCSSSSYDYHAAQLAAFLDEYRSLQNELIRMSESLNEVDGPLLPGALTASSPPQQFLPGSSSTSLTAGSSSSGNVPHQTHLTLQQRQTQNQLKSILKNPASNNTNNNNYMA